jgi:DNA-binding NtrC family response regulator
MTREEFQQKFGIAGESIEIKEVVGVLMQVAPTDLTVLITGESGTGKEVFAHAIHEASNRAKNKFVAVNCGAIPETLLESELFGHEKGSFTGAHEARKGFFELADSGTIFLDEIGEMSIGTQVKLLRVLESGEYNAVGASQSRHTNVRVIAATNKDLEFEIRRGAFRQDLYYRLRAVSIHLPPLRDRREDIPILFDLFAKQVATKHHIQFKGVAPMAMHRLEEYPWTGNIRELKNLVETMLVLEKGDLITEDLLEKYLPTQRVNNYLPMQLLNKTPEQAEREIMIRALIELKNEISGLKELMLDPSARNSMVVVHPEQNGEPGITSMERISMEDAEKKLITAALKRNRYNKRKAARELGISERTLYRKIAGYKILENDENE